jgi:hypothetical protein
MGAGRRAGEKNGNDSRNVGVKERRDCVEAGAYRRGVEAGEQRADGAIGVIGGGGFVEGLAAVLAFCTSC